MHELFGLRHTLKFLSSQGIRMGDMNIRDFSDSKMWGQVALLFDYWTIDKVIQALVQ
jgi:hypothetical protein